MLETLPPIERAVLALRYGLDGRRPLGVGAIASRLEIERERVRELELQALKALARPLANLLGKPARAERSSLAGTGARPGPRRCA